MTKQEILNRIKQILVGLGDESGDTDFSQRSEIAIGQIADLARIVIRTSDGPALLSYLILLLQENGSYNSNKAYGAILRTVARSLLNTYPMIASEIANTRAAPPDLIKFILGLSAPTLKERVSSRGINSKDNWLDPVTAEVMDYPVSYAINGVEQTVDLLTLINNSENCIGLHCPLTKQYIFLKDLRPRMDIVQEIRSATDVITAEEPQEISLAAACRLVRAGKFSELKTWYLQHPSVSLDYPVKDGAELKWTLLHNALRLSKFDIASWLIENGADVDVKNAEGKTPFDLVDLKKLKDALAADPNNLALKYLCYKYYENTKILAHMLNAVEYIPELATNKYPPYSFVLAKTSINNNSYVDAVPIINDVIQRNYSRGLTFICNTLNKINAVDAQKILALEAMGILTMPMMLRNFKAILSLSTPVFQREALEYEYARLSYKFASKEEFQHMEYNHIVALCFANLAWTRSHDPKAKELLDKVCIMLKFEPQEPSTSVNSAPRFRT